MKAETIFEVIQKLTGKVEPVADSTIDAERLKNMQTFIKVFEMMHVVIDEVATRHKESNFYSAREVAREAAGCIECLSIK